MKTIPPLIVAGALLGAALFSPTQAQEAGWVDVRRATLAPGQTISFEPRARVISGVGTEVFEAFRPRSGLDPLRLRVVGVLENQWAYDIDLSQSGAYANSAIVWRHPKPALASLSEAVWTIRCTEDRVDRRFECDSSKPLSFVIFETTNQRELRQVCALGHTFPGSEVRFRIDENRVRYLAPGRGCITDRRDLNMIMTGQLLVIEYGGTPFANSAVEELDLTGLQVALRIQTDMQIQRGRWDWIGRELPTDDRPADPS